MKPLKLELQAFGPFTEKQTVDFEKLANSGIFLIKGKTGSGKTTIFDAMMFALYGGGSGENEKVRTGRNDIGEWRCMQAPDTMETFVDFVFSSNDGIYYFKRILSMARKNFNEKYEAGEIDEGGNRHPFFSNPKEKDLNEKAAELVGLNKEQFRQVVLLPQGQFERFLTAPSGQKEEILQKIFGAERWKKYADAFYKAAADAKEKLDTENAAITNALAEEGVPDLEGLAETISTLKEDRARMEKEHLAFEGAKKREELDRDLQLSEQFKPMHELEAKIKEMEGMGPEIERKRKAYEASEKAETVRLPLREFEEAKKECEKRKKALKKLKDALSGAEDQKKKAETEKEAHEEKSPVTELTGTVAIYENKRDIYKNYGTVKSAFEKAEKELQQAEDGKNAVEAVVDSTKKAATDEFRKYTEENDAAGEFRTRYYAGIYGELAGQLETGKKCPVCGSTEHPSPAKRLPDSVSREEMEAKEKDAEEARKKWEKAESKRKKAEQEKQEKERIWIDKKQNHDKAHADLKATAKNLIEGIEDSDALERKIRELKNQIDTYEKEAKRLQTNLENADRTLTELQKDIKTAETEEGSARKKEETSRKAVNDAVEKAGFADLEEAKAKLLDDADRKRMHEEIVSYTTILTNKKKDYAEAKTSLKDCIEPDAAKFEERSREIDKEASDYSRDSSECDTKIGRLEKKQKALEMKYKHYTDQIDRALEELSFARAVRGDTGIGIQRYVLAVMFNQVIGEANRMLEKVHGGRYRLFRTDDRGHGNKTGLELKVHDSRSPEKEGRGVSMLSGGEKFLVSLALSIGMSTVAQTSGMRMEALFIDEGFGTLDDSSIHDALDILDSVRKGNGMIGIISHVQLLEDNIPTHLEVISSEEGSIIRQA